MSARRVVAVTGGGSGIGAATALRLARGGFDGVLLGYRESAEGAASVAEEIRAAGAEVEIAAVDVGEDASVRAFAEACAERFERCDAVVNAAGMTRWIPLRDLDAVSDADWSQMLGVNTVGPFRVARAFRSMLAETHGVIVNVGSTAGHRGAGSSVPYSVSKAAVLQLTRTLAIALAPQIRVVSVSPGTVDTRWHQERLSDDELRGYLDEIRATTPLARVVQAEEVADAIAGLVASTAVTGVDLIIDGGRHMTY